MKKVAHKLWVKILAFFICAAGGVGVAGSILGIIFLSEYGVYSENGNAMLESAFDSIAENYCAMVLDNYWETVENYNLDMLEDITDNLEYAVYYCSTKEADQYYWTGIIETEPLYRSSNSESSRYTHLFMGAPTTHGYYYYTDEIPHAMFSSGSREGYQEDADDGEWIETGVLRFLLSRRVFYAKTTEGYVEIPSVTIRKNVNDRQERIDCQLVRPEDDEPYYVDLNGKTVDFSDYASWTEVLIGDAVFRMGTEAAYSDDIPEDPQSKEIMICREPPESSDIIQPAKIRYEDGSLNYFLSYDNDGKSLWVFYNTPQIESLSTDTPDMFIESLQWMNHMYQYRRLAILILVISGICLIAGFAVLMYASGRRDADGTIVLRRLDRIPFALLAAAVFLIETWLVSWLWLLIEDAGYYYNAYSAIVGSLPLGLLFAFISMMVLLGFCMSLAVRCKAKCFWRYTLLHYILIPIRAFWRMCHENLPLMAVVILGYLGICFIEFILLTYFGEGHFFHYHKETIFALLIEKACVGALVVVTAFQLHRLFKGGKSIASGDMKPIDTVGMFYHFKKHGEDINRIGDGIAAAVERQMKSERMKTELITNVSHDIKTPLTSIINYVDLIKKEEITDPALIEYVDVLDRQSARLKKLIEDLIEASKASTGTLNVNMETFDATVMLTQFIGEFEERMQEAGLELIVSQPQTSVFIKADGRHLWRVVDNLMNNICKYTQPGTRVYIDMAAANSRVTILFRNISSARLNISSEELMERFVRGDSSRNTEGSGLGLSIALSLMQLMGGTMQLDVDGDLFKVLLAFPQVNM